MTQEEDEPVRCGECDAELFGDDHDVLGRCDNCYHERTPLIKLLQEVSAVERRASFTDSSLMDLYARIRAALKEAGADE